MIFDNVMLDTCSELSVVSFDVMLQKTVAGNVEKTMKMFAAKCERLVCRLKSLSQTCVCVCVCVCLCVCLSIHIFLYISTIAV